MIFLCVDAYNAFVCVYIQNEWCKFNDFSSNCEGIIIILDAPSVVIAIDNFLFTILSYILYKMDKKKLLQNTLYIYDIIISLICK